MTQLFVNANIHTFDPANPHATAILTDGETITAVGDAEDLKTNTSGVETVDLGGDTVIPGFVDAHLHALAHAESLSLIHI